MDRDTLLRWLDGYEWAWREGDVDSLAELFTPDARYHRSPYGEPAVGLAAIGEFWAEDAGRSFTVRAEPVAVDGPTAVVRLEVRYAEPVEQEYRDLWVLRFAPDGRVEHFEEWPHWPGQPYSAPADRALPPLPRGSAFPLG